MRAGSLPAAAALAVLTSLAGCGSTVQNQPTSGTLGYAGGTPGGLAVPSAAPGGAGPAIGPGPTSGGSGVGAAAGGAAAPGVSGSTSGPGGGSASGGGSSAAASGGAVPVRAPGVTGSKIYIGVEYSSQSAAGDRALGASGAAPSYDERNVLNADLAYANSHGGFAGRQLQAIYYDVDITADRSSQDQAACDHFTQDNKVFAIYAGDDVLRTCAEKAGALPLDVLGSTVTSSFQRFPHLVDPIGIRFDRLGQVTVNGLAKQSWFTGKLGLLTWDDPSYRAAVTNGYLPAFHAHGVSLATAPVFVGVPQSVGALGETSAAVQNAVTKFKTLGIDHVIIQDGPAGVFSGDGLTFEFMQQAKAQRYYPLYGGNTYNDPGASIYPPDEENHLLAVTALDYDAKDDAGWHTNSAREKCFALQKAAGYPPANDNDEGIAAQLCDMTFFLQQALNRASAVSVDGFLASVDQLGTSFSSATVYGTNLFRGRHDGGDSVRLVEYLSSCNCLKYRGGPFSAG